MITKKLNLLLLAGMLTLAGCEKVSLKKIEKLPEQDALLLNVEKMATPSRYRAHLYFDTDSNPETAEAMLSLNCLTEEEFLHLFNEASIGKIQKISQWDKAFPRNSMDKKWHFITEKTKE